MCFCSLVVFVSKKLKLFLSLITLKVLLVFEVFFNKILFVY